MDKKIKFMNMNRLSLNIYSFGYSAGFIKDERKNAALYQTISPIDVAFMAKDLNLGGVEIPIDKYFPLARISKLEDFIFSVENLGLRIYFDLEELNAEYINNIAGIVKEHGTFIRAKVSTFYGGNRFKYSEIYYRDLDNFSREIENSLSALDENNLKILVENHQDIVLQDIQDLINKFGKERIGINWDVGNSLPSGETPITFFEKMGAYIHNVHLKDYRIFKCEEGYIMSRCPLGKGFVDFKTCLNLLPNNIPLSIELGALNNRVAEINNSEYWRYTKGVSIKEKEEFIKYIDKVAITEGNYRSAWELKQEPEEIYNIEKQEMLESVNFIKSLF